MPEYPNTLPCPRLTGEIKFDPSFDKTEFEHNTRYRKSYYCETFATFQFIFSETEIVEFRNWYNNIIESGSLDYQADWKILGDSNTKTFHFDGSYSVSFADQYFVVDATLLIRDFR